MSREMNAFRSIVIARQLDELRTESAARRLARTPSVTEPSPRPASTHRRWSIVDEPGVDVPALRGYPYPAR
jgi:hypothetical protein